MHDEHEWVEVDRGAYGTQNGCTRCSLIQIWWTDTADSYDVEYFDREVSTFGLLQGDPGCLRPSPKAVVRCSCLFEAEEQDRNG